MLLSISLLLASLLVQTLLGISPHEERIPVELQTRLGRLRGFESIFLHRRVRSFLSVPFAEPPLGRRRFRPPEAKKPWNGTVEATQMSPACHQMPDTSRPGFWGSEMWNPNTVISEDCLYMNIWTPAEAFNLTVMVWLFGGGFVSGSPSLLLYDGKALALTANVVVININYRLGPFGFLYLGHEEVPGNMGMLDQQLALHWIREHVAVFGGDPSRIALFGESAGASSIVAHLIAPASRGLFKNGILQSGSLDNKWSIESPAKALTRSRAYVARQNCNRDELIDTINCLRSLPADFLLNHTYADVGFLEFPFVIVSRDANFFKNYDALVALRNREYKSDVNLMVGINHDEGTFWNIYGLNDYFDKKEHPLLNKEDYLACVNTAFSTQPVVVRDAAAYVYMGEKCDTGPERNKFYAEQVNQMVGDFYFTCDSIWLAEQMKSAEGKIYVYYFDQPSSANPWPEWTRVMHGYEIEFVFGVPLYNTTAGYVNREKAFSHKIIQYWKTFASEGIPYLEEKGGEPWPEYGKTGLWMYLKGGSHIKPIERRKQRECAMWRSVKDIEYANYLIELSSSASFKKVSLMFALWTLLRQLRLF